MATATATAVMYRDLDHVRKANEDAAGSFFADRGVELYRNLELRHGQYLVSSRWVDDAEKHMVYRVAGTGRITPVGSAATLAGAWALTDQLAGQR